MTHLGGTIVRRLIEILQQGVTIIFSKKDRLIISWNKIICCRQWLCFMKCKFGLRSKVPRIWTMVSLFCNFRDSLASNSTEITLSQVNPPIDKPTSSNKNCCVFHNSQYIPCCDQQRALYISICDQVTVTFQFKHWEDLWSPNLTQRWRIVFLHYKL